MRLAVGGFFHETNTYALGSTEERDFVVDRGTGLVDRWAATESYLGGLVEGAAAVGAEVVPLTYAEAETGPLVSSGAFEEHVGELVAALRRAGRVDAVALSLHGSAEVEGVDYADLDVVRRLRAVVGPGLPIGVTLDLHANLTQDLADAVDVLLPVHQYPHVDQRERGAELVSLLAGILAGAPRPVAWVERLPALLTTNTNTLSGPGAEVNELCFAEEARPAVLDCAWLHGMPWTDTERVGSAVLATVRGSRRDAAAAARAVAAEVWHRRAEFAAPLPTPSEAVARAVRAPRGPVVLADFADNPGGGAPGDATHLLAELLRADVAGTALAVLFDPETAALAHRAGPGAVVDVRLGGKHDPRHGRPLEVRARVESLTDGVFTLQAMQAGLRVELGPTARLVVGHVDVIVGSERWQVLDPEVFRLHGIDVSTYRIVAVKSANHFRAGFAAVAADIIAVDSPGVMCVDMTTFERRRAPGPLWPVDPEASYPPP